MEVDDPHPDEDEIKPFVAVGPSKEYSITVHKQTFDTGFIIVTIIFILIVITVLITCLFYSIKQVDITPVTPLPPTQTSTTSVNTGVIPLVANVEVESNGSAYATSAACLSNDRTEWKDDRCQCKYPYSGPTCSKERYDSNFYPVGIPNEDKINLSILDEFTANGLSYPSTKSTTSPSCSQACLDQESCIGFIYHPNQNCTLLRNNIIVSENDNIPYSSDLNSTLYIRSSDHLKFEGRIFLGEYPNYFPPRFWLVKESYKYLQLFPREIATLNFYPNYINLHGCYMGIYSLVPFAIDDVPSLLTYADSNKCYIHTPRTDLIVPDHWRYRLPIYVMYLPA